jgi:Na+/proline symporter
MGAGALFGGVPSVVHFFNPRNGPWVMAWFVTTAVLYVLAFVWLFLWNGAELLARHPAILGPSTREQSPAAIRLTLVLMIAGGIVAMVVMIFADIRVDALQ